MNNKLLIKKQFKIKKLHHKGYGIPENETREYQIWNALPGEIVEISFVKGKRFRKKTFSAEQIIEESPNRITPKESEHFLSCSPWQIIDWEEENRLKKEIVLDIFKEHKIRISDSITPSIPLIRGKDLFSYRNKMEFSFYINDNEKIHIAFHKRGSRGIIPIEECKLATDAINKTAGKIVKWINDNKIPKKVLKTLIVRSNQNGETIAGLFVKDENDPVILNSFQDPVRIKNMIDDQIKGLTVYYSNHKSPASTADKLLYQEGETWLEEKVGDVNLKYGTLSFFQINIPIFEKALKLIHKEIPENQNVIDFYSGVGSISLPIANRFKSVTLVDNNEESIEFAKLNIKENEIKNAQAICLPAEKITELIDSNKIIIVDPPRSGMHPKVVEKLLQELPPKIIYLSCNPNSQAIDLEMLQEKYIIKSMQIFNFFPRTPHIENLVILEKK